MSQLNIEPPKIGRPDEANCMDRAAKPKLGNNEEKGKILTTFWTQILYTVLALLLQKKKRKNVTITVYSGLVVFLGVFFENWTKNRKS